MKLSSVMLSHSLAHTFTVFSGLLALMMSLGWSTLGAAERFSYLLYPTSNSVQVMVHSDDKVGTTNKVQVKYGTTMSYGKVATAIAAAAVTSNPASFVFTVPLTGLDAQTVYHYVVSADAGVTWNADKAFTTAPNPGTPFRVGIYSDCRNNPKMHDKIAKKVLAQHPVMMIMMGDLAHDNAYKSFTSEFFIDSAIDLLRQAPLLNATGNHEGWKGNTLSFFKPSGGNDYGSYDYGDLHVLIVNCYVPLGPGSPQYNFIKSDLAASKKPWKIAAFHEPAYTSGNHPDNEIMKKITSALFEPNGVVMTLCGHNHFYQRCLVNGIHHVVVGSAGAPLYDPEVNKTAVATAKSFCYALADVTATTLTFNAFSDSDKALDSFTLTKTPKVSSDVVSSASIVATRPKAQEKGIVPGEFKVTVTPAPSTATTVTYTVSGTASSGKDFTQLPGTVMINSSGAASIIVTPMVDHEKEGDEAVTVTLNAGTGYTVGSSATATVTIIDDVLAR